MISISGAPITLDALEDVVYNGTQVSLEAAATERMAASRQVIERIVATDETVYGVNTGFGKLSYVRIPNEELGELQLNLVRSHSCGVGDPLSEPEVRAMLLLRANVLAVGLSGARPVVAETLIEMLNKGVLHVIPSR